MTLPLLERAASPQLGTHVDCLRLAGLQPSNPSRTYLRRCPSPILRPGPGIRPSRSSSPVGIDEITRRAIHERNVATYGGTVKYIRISVSIRDPEKKMFIPQYDVPFRHAQGSEPSLYLLNGDQKSSATSTENGVRKRTSWAVPRLVNRGFALNTANVCQRV